jgi:dephospho-CoA kinase
VKLIGIVGMPGSGKGEFSRIARSLGIPVIVMGDVIREEACRQKLPGTDANLGEIASRLRRERGMAAIAELTLPAIEGEDAPLVVVDGIRGDAEVGFFREKFPGFLLIGIDAPFAARLARLSSRGREDDGMTDEDLVLRDRREISWGLGRALAGTDDLLCNDGTVEEFEEKVRALLEEIREGP